MHRPLWQTHLSVRGISVDQGVIEWRSGSRHGEAFQPPCPDWLKVGRYLLSVPQRNPSLMEENRTK